MLKKLTIKNFQCHKSQELEFSPGVNVIAGSSDSGKSAILKSLLWLLTNKPQGIAFRSWDCAKNDMVEVAIALDNHIIARRRNEQVNEYLLDGKRFVAMKNEVPKDIAQILNLAPVNIQTQFQAHYLLAASPGEVAKTLNESCDLSVIDQTTKRINGICQTAKQESKVFQNNLDELQTEYDSLEWVEDANNIAEDLINESEAISNLLEKQKDLSRIISDFDVWYKDWLKLSKYSEVFEKSLPRLEKQVAKYLPMAQECDNLQQIVIGLEDIDNILAKMSPFIFNSLPDIENKVGVWRKRVVRHSELAECIDKLEGINTKLVKAQKELESVQTELDEVWQKLDICPLCGHAK